MPVVYVSDCGSHAWQTGHAGFERDQRTGFVPRGVHEKVRATVQRDQISRSQKTVKCHVGENLKFVPEPLDLSAQGIFACYVQAGVGLSIQDTPKRR